MAYFLLFLNSFIAATVLPLSSEPAFLALLSNGYSGFWLIVAAGAGNSLGGFTAYYLGYIARWTWLERYFKIGEIQVLKWQQKINRYGSILAFFCWLPFIGDVLAVALGFFRIKIVPVFLFLTVGKFFRYLMLWLAYQYF